MRIKNKGFSSIRWRMVLSFVLITVIGFGIVLFSVSQIVEGYLVRQRIGEQQNSVYQMAKGMEQSMGNQDAAALYALAVEYSQKLGGRVLVLDNNGVVQVDAMAVLNGQVLTYPEIARVLWGEKSADYGFHKLEGQSAPEASWLATAFDSLFPPKQWVVYYVCALEQGGVQNGAVVFSVSIQDVQDSVANIRTQILLVLLLVGCGILIAASLLARSITRPIQELTRVIRRMGRGEFNLRVKVSGHSEIDELGRTFNDMSERLENTEQFRSEFVSNASHEIKTPLATMKILIESLLYQGYFDEKVTMEFLGDVNQEIDRLNLVISDLLRMVQRDQTEERLHLQSVSVDGICADAVKRLTPIAQKKGIELSVELQKLQTMADPVKLEQVVFNIVDNAIKYTDGKGRVGLRLYEEEKDVCIAVSDQGIGISEKDIPHIFDRFYKVDKARSREVGGTGLGLAIVDKIVKLHGGRIDVLSELGKGTTFIVHIPKWNG